MHVLHIYFLPLSHFPLTTLNFFSPPLLCLSPYVSSSLSLFSPLLSSSPHWPRGSGRRRPAWIRRRRWWREADPVWRTSGLGTASRGSSRRRWHARVRLGFLDFYLSRIFFSFSQYRWPHAKINEIFACGCTGRMQKSDFSQSFWRMHLGWLHAKITFCRLWKRF